MSERTFHIDGEYLQEDARMGKPSFQLDQDWDEHIKYELAYRNHLVSLTRYPILPGNKWEKTEGLIEGKDFKRTVQCLKDCKGLCDECRSMKVYCVPLPAPKQKSQEEFFSPPDHDDICWQAGSETFTRKEVFNLLWTQRAMIGNDIKQTGTASNEVLEIIKNPRIPKF